MDHRTIGLIPHVHGVGGMVSFRDKLTTGLANRGIRIAAGVDDPDLAAVLVIGGTRDLAGLRRARRRGIRIVQRLDGINWIHRHRRTGIRHTLRAEIGNLLLQTIRDRYADRIVYQSRFVQDWWERSYGPARQPAVVIHNAVDLDRYTPEGPEERPTDHFRLLLVEGNLQGGYEAGLDTAVRLRAILSEILPLPVELVVAGRVSAEIQTRFNDDAIEWLGWVPAAEIPALDRSAHVLFSADLNPACPNAVIEALACGLPVTAFDTGALRELVGTDAGGIAPYGGDPWQLEPPDTEGLARAAAQVFENQAVYRRSARARAEKMFVLDRMVQAYLKELLEK
ncbi:MAG TPA: glycosyltransferase family 4 protein [Anaerolineales bacterium]|nr:glycosyltransferase family 4 protein [Anaerolineales bacterium]